VHQKRESEVDKTFSKIRDMPNKMMMVCQSEVAGLCDSTITFDHILDYAVFKKICDASASIKDCGEDFCDIITNM